MLGFRGNEMGISVVRSTTDCITCEKFVLFNNGGKLTRNIWSNAVCSGTQENVGQRRRQCFKKNQHI